MGIVTLSNSTDVRVAVGRCWAVYELEVILYAFVGSNISPRGLSSESKLHANRVIIEQTHIATAHNIC